MVYTNGIASNFSVLCPKVCTKGYVSTKGFVKGV